MTVVTLASRRAAPPVPCVQASAHPTTSTTQANELHLIQLHAQACTSLREALRQLQSPSATDTSASTWATATARAHRGLSALKQASALVNQAGG